MNITLERSRALTALSRVIGASGKKSTIPILNNVAIVAADNQVTFRATDLDMEATATFAATVTTACETTVDAEKLRQIFTNAAPGSEISLSLGEADDPRMVVKSGRSRFRLPVQDIADFPKIPDDEWASEFQIDADVFADMLSRTIFAASVDSSRPALLGTHLTIDDDKMLAVGCSGFRFAKVSTPAPDPKMPAVTLPTKFVGQAIKLLSDFDNVTVSLSENKARISVENGSLTGRLVDYPYLNFRVGFPEKWSGEARVGKDAFVSAVRRAAISGDEDRAGLGVKITLTPGVLKVVGRNNTEESADEIECDYDGPEITFGITSNYAIDAASNIGGDTIVIGVDEKNPVTVFTGVDDDGAVNTAVKRVIR